MASDLTTFQREVTAHRRIILSANTHNVDRDIAFYWRDAGLMFIVNGTIIRGRDAYREMQRRWWDDGRATGSYEIVGDPAYQVLDKGCGLTTIAMHARSKLPDGQIREREIAFTALWRRGSDGWPIGHAHESATK